MLQIFIILKGFLAHLRNVRIIVNIYDNFCVNKYDNYLGLLTQKYCIRIKKDCKIIGKVLILTNRPFPRVRSPR